MKKFIAHITITLLATQLVNAEVPPIISAPMPSPEVTVCFGHVSPPPRVGNEETPTTAKEYGVTLLRNTSSLCKGVIIAPSWVLTAKHCATQRLNFVTAGKKNQKKRVEQKIRFRGADIALLRVKKASFTEDQSAQVLAIPLPTSHQFTYKKVIHKTNKSMPKIYDELTLKVKNKKRLKSFTPRGKAGSSGAPWVVNTDKGDVVVGITHGGGRAPQIAQAKKWIDAQIKKWTPNENVKWMTDIDTILEAQ